MTKKAKRRQIMEAVGYPDERVEYIGENEFTYKRSGEFLKKELQKILEHLDLWQNSYKTQHKGAWVEHIREAVDIKYEKDRRWDNFSYNELTQIWRKVAFCTEHNVMYDETEEEFYCPVCEK